MAPAKQIASLPFVGGLDTKSDPFQVAPNQLLALRNGVFTNPGEIRKRNGFQSLTKRLLPATQNLAVGQMLTAFLDELLLGDGQGLYSYNSSGPGWIRKGTITSANVTQTPVIQSLSTQAQQDGTQHPSGMQLFAWEDSEGGLYYTVKDSVSGQFTVGPTLLAANGIKPRVVAIGNIVAIIYYDTVQERLYMLPVPVASPLTPPAPVPITGPPSSGTLYAINATAPNFDVALSTVAMGGNQTPALYVAFNNTNAGGISVTGFFGATPTVGFAVYGFSNTSSAPASTLTLFPDGYTAGGRDPNLIVAWSLGAGGVFFAPVAPDLTTSSTPTQIDTVQAVTSISGIGIPSTTALSILFYYGLNETTGLTTTWGGGPQIQIRTASAAGTGYTPVASAAFLYNMGLGGKAFALNGLAYLPVAYGSLLESTTFVVNQNGAGIAKILFEQSGGCPYRTFGGAHTIPSVTSTGITTFLVPLRNQTIEPLPLRWTATLDGVVAGNNVVFNGVTFTAIASGATGNQFNVGGSDSATATNLATAINGSVSAGISEQIEAAADGAVVTIVGNLTSFSNGTTIAVAQFGVQPYDQTGVLAVSVDLFDGVNSFLRAELGGNIHFGGGFLWAYDGETVAEHGFHLYPEMTAAPAAQAGGSLQAGPYQYCIVWRWVDARGQVHRSAPSESFFSDGQTLNATAGQAGVIRFAPLPLTGKQNVTAEIYRTAIDPASGVPGDTFYLCLNTQLPVTASTSTANPNAPILNDPTQSSLVFIDNMSDPQLIGNPQLYTTGGEVDHIAPDPLSSLTVFSNRVVGLSTLNPNVLWFSTQYTPGPLGYDTAPIAFSDEFTFNIDPRGGATTAIAGMDDKLILFKESSIFFLYGDGPASNGTGTPFSEPQVVTTDCGCTNPRSIVITPAGLIFQSAKGFYLLDRGLSVTYIGAPVEAFNGLTATSAVLIANTNQVRISLGPPSASSSLPPCVMLVYDYFVKQWSVFTLPLNAVDATIWQGQHCWLDGVAGVHVESPGVYSDDGNAVLLGLTTAWLSLSGLQGYQRVSRVLVLGTYASPHKLQVSFAYDFAPVVFDTYTIDPPPSSVFGGDPVFGSSSPFGGAVAPYQWRTSPAPGKRIQALQVTLQEQQPVSINGVWQAPGEGLRLSALALEWLGFPGVGRVPAARTVGR